MSKCIVLLSDKSSGSSAVQRALSRLPEVKTLRWTPHAQNETLYWVKASAALGLSQDGMLYSSLPYSQKKGQDGIAHLLKNNLGAKLTYADLRDTIFEGWKMLCIEYSPVLFEKSPHHLFNWSSIDLMLQFVKENPDIEFRFVGLVRNPMDTIYSYWSRWRLDPVAKECEWRRGYENLQKLNSIVPQLTIIIRYEDIVVDPRTTIDLLDFIGLDSNAGHDNRLHSESICKWRGDRFFGHQLSEETMRLAESYGYQRETMFNPRRWLWPVSKFLFTRSYNSSMKRKKALQFIRELKNRT